MNSIWQKILIYIIVLFVACIITVFTFDNWQNILIIVLLLISISYLIIFTLDKLSTQCTPLTLVTKEGFTSESDASTSKYEWLTNEDLFDDFYASIFTKLTQNEKLIQAESAICMEEFTRKTPKDELHILDAACGIGIGTLSFSKQGAASVTGIDKSNAMIRYAKNTTLPSSTLTELQRQGVDFRIGDLMGATTAAAAEFTDACLLYFSVYYFQDMDALFRNLHLWVKPGGTLAIEVVNKYKFEPILDSTNPWVGFSPQKFSKERLTTSKVVFDKFDYEAKFELFDPKAEFRETFRFKDGSVRRQKHTLNMISMPDIIKKAQNAGWTYHSYVDLTPMAFPYGYILFFKRNPE
jgi:SAM-dependent methyltransferase